MSSKADFLESLPVTWLSSSDFSKASRKDLSSRSAGTPPTNTCGFAPSAPPSCPSLEARSDKRAHGEVLHRGASTGTRRAPSTPPAHDTRAEFAHWGRGMGPPATKAPIRLEACAFGNTVNLLRASLTLASHSAAGKTTSLTAGISAEDKSKHTNHAHTSRTLLRA